MNQNYVLELYGLSDEGKPEGAMYLKLSHERTPSEAISAVQDILDATHFEDPHILYEIACLYTQDRWATGNEGPVYAGFRLIPIETRKFALPSAAATVFVLKLRMERFKYPAIPRDLSKLR